MKKKLGTSQRFAIVFFETLASILTRRKIANSVGGNEEKKAVKSSKLK